MTQRRRRYFAGQPEKAGSMSDVKGSDIDNQFVELVSQRKYDQALEILPQVENPNLYHPKYQATALHMAAARSAAAFIDKFTKSREDIDFLMKDSEGQLASQVAWHYAKDEILGATLMILEREYAKKTRQQPPCSQPSLD